jgi:nucleoside-diphosphate-sugar epimerase
MKKFEKILVTGGAGFIGSYLINNLLKNEKQVVIFDNGFRVGFNNIQNNSEVELIQGDILNKADWEKIPKDIDYVFHLAAINGTKYFYEIPHTVLNVNVQGILNFLNWVGKTNANSFFFASSSEVYGFPKNFPTKESESLIVPDPKNPRFSYSSSKIIGETLSINFAKSIGIDYNIARFHNIYGPQMGFEHVMPDFIRKIVKNKIFNVMGDGSESRSFCYISDAIEAILLISQHQQAKNEIFNIGTNEEVTINQLINTLSKISGTDISPIYEKFENPGTKRRNPDITRLKKLGYNPKILLQEGLKKTYEWYSQYYRLN